jgi:uncharacterized protein (TIGR04222 family)
MNPFALHGPAFLAFYAAVGVAAIGIQYFWTRLQESLVEMPPLQMTDPYQIAYLRGGRAEALKVVAFSLIDRGLLNGSGRTLVAEPGADKQVRRAIEKSVLWVFRKPEHASAMQSHARAIEACQQYRDTLQDHGLIAGVASFARLVPFLIATMAVVFVGALKLFIALSEGRHNVGFLIALMIAFSVLAILILQRHRTKRGDDMMADLRMMFGRLRDRADTLRQGGATNEAALLAAVFGISELSPAQFPALRALKPAKRKTASSGSTSSCSNTYSSCGSSSSWSSSSCGSSGGDSGSSCGGGGGCGGGCGG